MLNTLTRMAEYKERMASLVKLHAFWRAAWEGIDTCPVWRDTFERHADVDPYRVMEETQAEARSLAERHAHAFVLSDFIHASHIEAMRLPWYRFSLSHENRDACYADSIRFLTQDKKWRGLPYKLIEV